MDGATIGKESQERVVDVGMTKKKKRGWMGRDLTAMQLWTIHMRHVPTHPPATTKVLPRIPTSSTFKKSHPTTRLQSDLDLVLLLAFDTRIVITPTTPTPVHILPQHPPFLLEDNIYRQHRHQVLPSQPMRPPQRALTIQTDYRHQSVL